LGIGPIIGAGRAGPSVGELTGGAFTVVKRVVKLADTPVFAVRVRVQLGVTPLQAPPQPARPHPVAGLAVTVT
jgi:hypothetical protein